MAELERTYIGGDKVMWCEIQYHQTWADLIEWLQASNPYDIDSMRVFYGPGSALTVHVICVQHEPESHRGEIIGRELLPINPNRHSITLSESGGTYTVRGE